MTHIKKKITFIINEETYHHLCKIITNKIEQVLTHCNSIYFNKELQNFS